MAREKNVPGGTGMLLLSLLSRQEMYGYQMITALRERGRDVRLTDDHRPAGAVQPRC